ncbi:MAG: M23 family metallopeptidase [Chitinophagaceae bacterium]
MISPRAKRRLRRTLYILLAILVAGFLLPQPFRMPVAGAGNRSYAPDSFWYYPWGKSVTHKGVDIFARKGTPVHPATYGIVLYKGKIDRGGNVVLVLGPKWRLHYYAHLDSIYTHRFALVSQKTVIGTVGATGNAAGKPPHLHYTMRTLIPYPWRMDKSRQGWKKMFYLDPTTYLQQSTIR